MKSVIALGTRPEITKLSELIRNLKNSVIVFTGQHYDHKLSDVFFQTLNLRKPDYKLTVDNRTRGSQISSMIKNVEMILISEEPDILITLGDTNSTLACALVSANMNIDLIHVEAGCRSFDKSMPEEINRKMVDAIADVHISPTTHCTQNLKNEGITDTVFQLGHPIVDTMKFIEPKLKRIPDLNEKILLTIHRQANIGKKLKPLMSAIDSLGFPIIFPIHPHTRKKLFRLNVKFENIEFIPPLPYIEFLEVMRSSKLILTDSGGVQQEAFLLEVPCITLRDRTEWKETFDLGGNFLVPDYHKIAPTITKVMKNEEEIRNKIKMNKETIFGTNVTKKIKEFLKDRYL